MSCHLWNLDTHETLMIHPSLVLSPLTPATRLLQRKANSESPTILFIPTFVNSESPVIHHLDAWPSQTISYVILPRVPPIIESARFFGQTPLTKVFSED